MLNIDFMCYADSHVQKVMDKIQASDVSKKVEYLLNTGNLVSQSGLDLNQVIHHLMHLVACLFAIVSTYSLMCT